MLRTDSRKLEKGKYGFVIFLCAVVVFFIDFLLNVIRSGTALDMDLLTWIYYIPSALGHAFVLGLIIFLIGFVPFAVLFKNHKIATGIFLTFLVITQVLLILNTYVYSFYKFHLNGIVFSLAFEGGSEVFEIGGGAVYLKFIALILLAAVFPFLIAQWISKNIHTKFTRKRMVWTFSGLFICVVYSHLGHATAAAVQHSGIRKSALAMPYFFRLQQIPCFSIWELPKERMWII
ncbi:MAG: DUF3413 domain-containing protein [Tannerellaceae bacterium]|nr:DUF3413 domain-containing protein [Tannerellaceae bacterium]